MKPGKVFINNETKYYEEKSGVNSDMSALEVVLWWRTHLQEPCEWDAMDESG
jgi:hypothetical protein